MRIKSRMRSFRDVIAQWPSAVCLAEDLGFQAGLGGLRVRAWRRRDSIPPEYWRQLEEAAKRRRIRVTIKILANIAASKHADARGSEDRGDSRLVQGAV
jgi:hypothetical protein